MRRRCSWSEIAPADDALDGEPEDRPRLEGVVAVLRVLRPELVDRAPMLAGGVFGIEDGRGAVEPDPAEAVPILRPSIHEQRRPRPLEDVTNASEAARVGAFLRLVVD